MTNDDLLHLLQRFSGIVSKMREHQNKYFHSRNEYDKKKAMLYEKQADDYLRLLQKRGIQPLAETQHQQTLL